MDIKPGSHPNSINVNNNGVVTIALLDQNIDKNNALEPIESIELHLHPDGEKSTPISYLTDVNFRYEFVNDNSLEVDPYLTGNGETGNGYLVKIRTQDLSKLFYDDDGNYLVSPDKEYLLSIKFGGNEYTDTISLISNK